MVPLWQVGRSSRRRRRNHQAAELQRRVALYANVGRPSGEPTRKCSRSSRTSTLPGYRFDVGGQAKDMAESFRRFPRRRSRRDLHLPHPRASQFASYRSRSRSWPAAVSLIGVFLALLLTERRSISSR
jgi:hypothetical protein